MLYIGTEIKDRMKLLNLTAEELADKTFLEEEYVKAVLNNEVALESVDEFDLSLICSALHCRPEYFTDESIKSRDLLLSSMNRGCDTEKSILVKARLQDFMDDFAFVKEVLAEVD